MSGEVNGLTIDVDGALDPECLDDCGVPAGELLLRYVSAVGLGVGDPDQARSDIVAALGHEALVEAAATIAIFNGLVRVADGTGIALDDGVLGYSADFRDRLGLNDFGGAANSNVNVAAAPTAASAADLFG